MIIISHNGFANKLGFMCVGTKNRNCPENLDMFSFNHWRKLIWLSVSGGVGRSRKYTVNRFSSMKQ